MAAIDMIKRRLKEDRVPDVPDEIGEKKKRPREVAFAESTAYGIGGRAHHLREKINAEERALLGRERK